ncbi:type I-E CRISPR-associated protein Cas6/Cse3/CasE [Siccirubricoccus phaeus]|uniref:type I-E CRISPR-associated protein Cas6/Cse3/CasE n=1 Tax=Siccirubricoccus phaeus TaxID=2595053 RepID=UPI0011F37FB7|nr:type I-E CRISPR-associated protein Cas6/Cse3/CasE [Siccirubricoccus phaeus]
MTALHLSRVRLRRDAQIAALARLLLPEETGAQAVAAHRLIWALFADAPERQRDFLWRQEQPGQYLALSRRPPLPLADVFEIETKEFAPALAAGDRLGFRLHANPVVAAGGKPGQRGRRHDVVMHALHRLPAGAERAEARLETAIAAGRAWFARQGEAQGFAPVGEVAIDGYETVRLPREGAPPIRYSVLDFEGVLTVLDPPRFLAALAQGFGRARAFGCGLMLIRRAG